MLDYRPHLTRYSAATQCQEASCDDFLVGRRGARLAKQEFGALIAQLRRELAVRKGKDITQADVARHMGITRSAYKQWEKGQTKPKDIGAYRRLAEFLEVSVADFPIDVGSIAPAKIQLRTTEEEPLPVEVRAPRKKAKTKRVQGARPR